MNLWLRIPGFQECSWAYVWQGLAKAFAELGHRMPDDPFKPPLYPEKYIELWWGDPKDWVWSGLPVKMKAGIALTEARSILAKKRSQAIDNIGQCEVLFCPSRHAAIGFEESPIDGPDCHIIPFGVDCNVYPFVDRDWSETLHFLLLGYTQFRKGSWIAPEAFIKAFNLKDDVRLTIACSHGEKSPMYCELLAEYGRYPQIKFDPEMKKTAMAHYQNHHVLLSPHLSEGFGLCIPEAMATGMPCLVSRCSAPREFFSKDYGWWIEMSENYAPVRYCLSDTAGFWRLPDGESLAEMMQYAHNHRDECQQKGAAASKFVSNHLTWELTAQKIVAILEQKIT